MSIIGRLFKSVSPVERQIDRVLTSDAMRSDPKMRAVVGRMLKAGANEEMLAEKRGTIYDSLRGDGVPQGADEQAIAQIVEKLWAKYDWMESPKEAMER